jgi:Ca2+-transporting ATPase
VDQPIFGRRVLMISALQGVGVFVAVAMVYLWSVGVDDPADRTRSLTFAALVSGNLALILVNRSWRLSVMRTFVERRNPMLKWILGVTSLVTVLLLYVPVLRNAFGFGSISAGDLVLVVAVAMIGVSWFEIAKALGRRGIVSLTNG